MILLFEQDWSKQKCACWADNIVGLFFSQRPSGVDEAGNPIMGPKRVTVMVWNGRAIYTMQTSEKFQDVRERWMDNLDEDVDVLVGADGTEMAIRSDFITCIKTPDGYPGAVISLRNASSELNTSDSADSLISVWAGENECVGPSMLVKPALTTHIDPSLLKFGTK